MPLMNSAGCGNNNIAAIDLGSNSAHLVIAEVANDNQLHILDTDKIALRLASSITAKGNLSEDAIKRTVAAFRQMKEIAEAYTTTIRAVATHAVREARNHKLLIDRIYKETNIKLEIIDGIEEARLEFLGMQQGLPVNCRKSFMVDIGGGSTEMIIGVAGANEFDHMSSVKVGAVTMTNRFLKGSIQRSDIKKMEEYIDNSLAPLVSQAHAKSFELAIASSGTAKALATIASHINRDLPLTDANGFVLSTKEIDNIYKDLCHLRDPKLIKSEYPVDATRAEIILAGTSILKLISKRFGVKEWTVSTYSLREGLVVDTVQRIVGGDVFCGANIRWQNVVNFGRKLRIEASYAQHVSRLATCVYDELVDYIDDSDPIPQERELVAVAAYLVEVGKSISYPRFHKHSAYILSQSNLMGFTQFEKQVLAHVVRYHRKSIATRTKAEVFPVLWEHLDRINFLAACVRIATSLNRTRQQKVSGVKLTKPNRDTLKLNVQIDRDQTVPETEIYKLNLEIPTLEKVLGFGLIVDVI